MIHSRQNILLNVVYTHRNQKKYPEGRLQGKTKNNIALCNILSYQMQLKLYILYMKIV